MKLRRERNLQILITPIQIKTLIPLQQHPIFLEQDELLA